ncbi:hypothetical protein BST81_16060 [Leptolyngbya sp. 'hensonii']|uniref:MFS transporter n=1 Tax=Leptolyngbya sp. 'hensonii' TaxID=1922337 RepID=UPI00094FB801|nr:MFS transporter [Leptolyngbya sp. 'hensonii']OLP17477.1 hypothetical protein BST81_16060 [Leptolyngbya sp. 'hensonii']
MKSLTSDQAVLWRQVWGLAALLAAIVFSWMVYGFYQPRILEQLGFSGLAAYLGVIQGILGAGIEPIVGIGSDRMMQRIGSRLPLIAVGVTLAGIIFVLASLLLQVQVPVAMRWLIPVLMTLWVIAMIIFRGPAIALLMQFAPTSKLPRASSILVFVFGLVGALGPLLGSLIQALGTSLTFALGAIVLLAGAMLLWSTNLQTPLPPMTSVGPSPSAWQSTLIFGVGVGVGLEVNFLLRCFPTVLQPLIRGSNADYIAAAILLVSALVALPIERVTRKLGLRNAMLTGLGTMVALMGVALQTSDPGLAIALTLGFGVALGLLFITQIPFTLALVPPTEAGWGTGLYFGGMGAATALVSLLLQSASAFPSMSALVGSAIGFSANALCISQVSYWKCSVRE